MLQSNNSDLQWNEVAKALSLMNFENNGYYPFTIEECKMIYDLFQDEDLLVIEFDILFQMIFGKNKIIEVKSRSLRQAMNNILLFGFPFLIVTINFSVNENSKYIFDLTKFDKNKEELTKTFISFLKKLQENEESSE